MDAIETIEFKGLTIKIFADDCGESPREWDNLGTLVCFDREYQLGDGGFSNRRQLLEHVLSTGAAWLPVMLHRGYQPSLSIDRAEMVRQKLLWSTLPSDFTDDDLDSFWPREQVGLIFIEPDKLTKEYGEDSADTRERVFQAFQSEIETYNQYLAGEVYGYSVERPVTCGTCEHTEMENVDSCWGFYGLEYCKKEAMEAAKHAVAAKRKQNRNTKEIIQAIQTVSAKVKATKPELNAA